MWPLHSASPRDARLIGGSELRALSWRTAAERGRRRRVLAVLQYQKAIGGRTCTIERPLVAQGVDGISNTVHPVGISAVPPRGQAPTAAGHLGGIVDQNPRRHGLESERRTCYARVPGPVPRAGAQAGVARRRRRDSSAPP